MDDQRHGRKNPSAIPIDGDLRTGLATLHNAVCLYMKFRGEEPIGSVTPEPSTPVTSEPRPAGSLRGLLATQSPLVRPRTATKPAVSAILNGDEVLLNATTELGIDLPRLIARSAVWANPAVFQARRRQHANGAWFPDCRRGKNGEPKRGMANGVRFDDNTWANLAIKIAVLGSRDRCVRMHVCHVWPETCYDVRYHTSLANLVLLPAPLAGLSDHHRAVADCLRYRSYELFGWYPEEATAPVKPVGYPSASDWAPPPPIPPSIREKFAI